jgi:hypothetical protein
VGAALHPRRRHVVRDRHLIGAKINGQQNIKRILFFLRESEPAYEGMHRVSSRRFSSRKSAFTCCTSFRQQSLHGDLGITGEREK